mmetsp:Transcript_36352/g.81618  ORF Transcript_36352/g.81618 Transcript_36352/m.81618 type:complete len:118 (+) Transcript_36352:353-706(+)
MPYEGQGAPELRQTQAKRVDDPEGSSMVSSVTPADDLMMSSPPPHPAVPTPVIVTPNNPSPEAEQPGIGCGVGNIVGVAVGSIVGAAVGNGAGCIVGGDVGAAVGSGVGFPVGRGVG